MSEDRFISQKQWMLLLGFDPSYIIQWRKRKRFDDLPSPVYERKRLKLYDRAAVMQWCRTHYPERLRG